MTHYPFEPVRVPSIKPPVDPALEAFKQLVEEIQTFEKDLGPDEVLGLIAGATGMVIRLGAARRRQGMLILSGTDDQGRPAELVQHYTQVSFMLTALPSTDPEPKRIGFTLDPESKTG